MEKIRNLANQRLKKLTKKQKKHIGSTGHARRSHMWHFQCGALNKLCVKVMPVPSLEAGSQPRAAHV